ncbi:pyridoxamine 5'-phosphate oxidase family protein, partial [Kibdelosporangium lantanae]
VRIMALATVTATGEPRVGPVDALFYRGHFYFGSAPDSAKFRHIRKRPQVSGSVIEGEDLAITVHGHAVEINTADHQGFRDHVIETYGDTFWEDIGRSASYARIDATQMLTYAAPKG